MANGQNASQLQTIGDSVRTAQNAGANVPRGIRTLKATASGNGATTVFTFPHGMRYTPAAVDAVGSNAVGNAAHTATADATNVTVTFGAAPPAGTNNIGLVLALYN